MVVCEAKFVITAINQMWTKEKLSNLWEYFVQKRLKKKVAVAWQPDRLGAGEGDLWCHRGGCVCGDQGCPLSQEAVTTAFILRMTRYSALEREALHQSTCAGSQL